MDVAWLTRQWLDAQKTVFDHGYDALSRIQLHGERMSETLFRQAAWVPEDGRKALDQWNTVLQQGRSEWKRAVDDQFEQARKLFGPPEETPKTQW